MNAQQMAEPQKNSGGFVETLQQLRADYASSLPARIEEVETAADGLADQRSPDVEAATLSDLRNLAHKLAGSGATFGFAAMGETARLLERLAEVALEADTRLSDSTRADLFGLVKELRSAALRGADTEIVVAKPAVSALPKASTDHDVPRPIILVEDDESLARQLSVELENFGFAVTVLPKPCALEAALAENACAAIVMDVVFDGDDKAGTDTIGRLRDEGLLTQPVIFLSGRNDARARIAAVRAGCDAYLIKPVVITELVDTLDRNIGPEDTEPYRILIIDDDPSMATYSDTVLKDAGMITMTATDPLQALEAIEAFSPELVLLDLYMQTCSGTELAVMIRQNLSLAGLPIVFLSNESETASQLEAMRRGGDDFLTKSMRPDHLVTALSLRASRFRALRALMVRDSLTGLLDHSATKQALETEIARAKRNGEPLTYALIDIDHFKSVNDVHGHLAGDWVIKSLARLLKQRLRGVDIIGRMGGEEFAVVLAGADSAIAKEICDEIRAAFSEIVHRSDDGVFQVTFSCGLAEFPRYGTANMLTGAADKALYEAKRGGRNRVIVSQAPIRETALEAVC